MEIRGSRQRPSASADHLTSGRLLLAYQDAVSELGGKANSWLEEAGIDPEAPADHSAQVPLRSVGHLLESTAARLGCPDLGMRLAERQSMQATMQPLDPLFWTAQGGDLGPAVRGGFTGFR